MQQFVVPQFIDVEDKIIGPITTRQFVIIVTGGVFGFVFFKAFDFSAFLLAIVVDLALIYLFGFFKVGGFQKFHEFLLNFIKTTKRPKIRIWKKTYTTEELRELIKPIEVKKAKEIPVKPPLSSRHLAEIALTIDTGGAYAPESGDLKID